MLKRGDDDEDDYDDDPFLPPPPPSCCDGYAADDHDVAVTPTSLPWPLPSETGPSPALRAPQTETHLRSRPPL